MKFCIVVALALACGACATVVKGTSQAVSLTTPGAPGAVCTLTSPAGLKLLSFDKTKETKSENLARIREVSNGLAVKFDYLDPRDGATFEIFVDDIEDDSGYSISGRIKGFPDGLYRAFKYDVWPTPRQRFGLGLGSTLCAALATLLVIDVYNSGLYTVFSIPKIMALIVLGIIALLLVVLPLADYTRKEREFPKSLQ